MHPRCTALRWSCRAPVVAQDARTASLSQNPAGRVFDCVFAQVLQALPGLRLVPCDQLRDAVGVIRSGQGLPSDMRLAGDLVIDRERAVDLGLCQIRTCRGH